MWIKMWKSGRLVKDMTVENAEPLNRTKKVFDAIDKACLAWDLPHPQWLPFHITDFKRHSRTRFGQDAFLETIEFDWLEVHVIEEDH